jgi:hypothetical protein
LLQTTWIRPKAARALGERVHGVGLRDVADERGGLDAVLRDLVAGLAQRARLDVGERQLHARGAERARQRAPDPAGRARDDGDLAFDGLHLIPPCGLGPVFAPVPEAC